jgi:hypothetical protein
VTRRAAPPLALAVGLGLAPAVAAEPTHVDLRLEAGGEYDSNVHRAEVADDEPSPVVGAPLLRLAGRGRLAWGRGAERVVAGLRIAGKSFAGAEARREDVAVVAGDASWDHALAARAATLGARVRYYDAFGRDEAVATGDARTFRSGWAEAGLGLRGPDGHRLRLDGGWGLFRFKPDARLDWDGPGGAVGWHDVVWRGDPDRDPDAASIELGAAYRIERRGYDVTARTAACADGADDTPACAAPTRLGRADLHHALGLEAVWTGARVYSARYELEINDSNSYGESLVRHRLELGATVELGAALYLTGEVAVLYNVFLDPLLVARDAQAQTFLTVDEENRNSLTALLARRVGEGTTLEARYALYSNEFATEALAFRRQTFYLGVVHEL